MAFCNPIVSMFSPCKLIQEFRLYSMTFPFDREIMISWVLSFLNVKLTLDHLANGSIILANGNIFISEK